jgi:hypothetical protein
MTTASAQATQGFALIWALLFAVILLLEGYTLGTHGGETLSAVVRAQLQHPIGRFVFYPLWAWLTWHWFLAPSRQPTWRDLIACTIGAAAALFVTLRGWTPPA